MHANEAKGTLSPRLCIKLLITEITAVVDNEVKTREKLERKANHYRLTGFRRSFRRFRVSLSFDYILRVPRYIKH